MSNRPATAPSCVSAHLLGIFLPASSPVLARVHRASRFLDTLIVSPVQSEIRMVHSTTILAVRHRGQSVLAGDGQVTFGQTVMKQGARKIRRLYNDQILAGFAGSACGLEARLVV